MTEGGSDVARQSEGVTQCPGCYYMTVCRQEGGEAARGSREGGGGGRRGVRRE